MLASIVFESEVDGHHSSSLSCGRRGQEHAFIHTFALGKRHTTHTALCLNGRSCTTLGLDDLMLFL